MAVPQVQFFTPTRFHGKDEEDGVEWLQRYEAAGRYNAWTPRELLTNFERYIEGSCRQWYQCLTPVPIQWEYIPEIAPLIGAAMIPRRPQVKTLFEVSFQQENYTLYQEQKLRDKKQERGESATSYYYDVLNLCRKVDQNMAEQTKLNYLYKGLDRGLLRKIYPLQPPTCTDFLAKVKVFTTTELLANQLCSQERESRSLAEKLNEEVNVTINCLRMENMKIDEEKEELKKQIRQLQQQKEGLSVGFMEKDTSTTFKEEDFGRKFEYLKNEVEIMKNELAHRNLSYSYQGDYYENNQDQDSYSNYGELQESSQNFYRPNKNYESETCQLSWEPDIPQQECESFYPVQDDWDETTNSHSQVEGPICYLPSTMFPLQVSQLTNSYCICSGLSCGYYRTGRVSLY